MNIVGLTGINQQNIIIGRYDMTAITLADVYEIDFQCAFVSKFV